MYFFNQSSRGTDVSRGVQRNSCACLLSCRIFDRTHTHRNTSPRPSLCACLLHSAHLRSTHYQYSYRTPYSSPHKLQVASKVPIKPSISPYSQVTTLGYSLQEEKKNTQTRRLKKLPSNKNVSQCSPHSTLRTHSLCELAIPLLPRS
ncbi:hypothetical protein BU24DRAFT_150149 [Aaosphaeria arxii CBS 175.79]|uniref:Uncharacterized protein n=1 Tax=Aaosphaeria arxii CBS 175.79 TaxID=1450172 RepID=A0A6A5XX64_9PLEO|nr:uncharacterized protein BU24DRAFT_150149 [Aaosphaeria arxii CBS 175.79]KAF2017417.1 hypothetical protein BU24DRAFT_150149 [Aaosphaeria arxii CBS 175.79]